MWLSLKQKLSFALLRLVLFLFDVLCSTLLCFALLGFALLRPGDGTCYDVCVVFFYLELLCANFHESPTTTVTTRATAKASTIDAIITAAEAIVVAALRQTMLDIPMPLSMVYKPRTSSDT